MGPPSKGVRSRQKLALILLSGVSQTIFDFPFSIFEFPVSSFYFPVSKFQFPVSAGWITLLEGRGEER
jgi:hypothetical protein